MKTVGELLEDINNQYLADNMEALENYFRSYTDEGKSANEDNFEDRFDYWLSTTPYPELVNAIQTMI